MFDTENFLKTELIKGLKNGSFTSEQVKIFAFNYMDKGHISETCFNELRDIADAWTVIETQQNAENVQPEESDVIDG